MLQMFNKYIKFLFGLTIFCCIISLDIFVQLRNIIFDMISSITKEGIIALVAALFALLLPLMILLLENMKTDGDQDLPWTNLVLIDLIIKPKEFVILCLCQLLPLLWWGDDKTRIRNFILFFIILIGISLYSSLLYRIYRWLSNRNETDYQFERRLEYVTNYKGQNNNIIEIWKNILEKEKRIDLVFSTKQHFIENLFKLIQQKKFNQTTRNQLLNSYALLIDSIKLNNFNDAKAFYEKSIKYSTQKILSNENSIDKMEKVILKNLMHQIIKRMKQRNEIEQSIFFTTLVQQINSYDKKDKSEFANLFGKNLIIIDSFDHSANSYWNEFPLDWKIDGNNEIINADTYFLFNVLNDVLFDEVKMRYFQNSYPDTKSMINFQNLIDNMLLNINLMAYGNLFYLFAFLYLNSDLLVRQTNQKKLQLLIKKWMLTQQSFGWASGVELVNVQDELIEKPDRMRNAYGLIRQTFPESFFEKMDILNTNSKTIEFEPDDLVKKNISMNQANSIKNDKIKLLHDFSSYLEGLK